MENSQSLDTNTQIEILEELKKNNVLLESLIEIQGNVQTRQRKFWFMAMAQIGLLLFVFIYLGTKYGF
ncbi:MAG: hypothetical protein GY834_16395 [Bacteroidetes bacterium]|nr:hypothetical protein [Bacteroidota bacterium]